MIEVWIDHLADVWAGITDQRFGSVRSIALLKRAEFPDAISADELAQNPIALTIPSQVEASYSAGGPQIGFWKGVTEFHVSASLDRALLPSLLPWYGKIITAAATHMTLNGTVVYFVLEDAIEGPLALQYGDETAHWGFIAHWVVKENLAGQFTPAA